MPWGSKEGVQDDAREEVPQNDKEGAKEDQHDSLWSVSPLLWGKLSVYTPKKGEELSASLKINNSLYMKDCKIRI